MTNYVMQREVCLKHRNNRREIILRVRTQIRVGSGVCSFCRMRRGRTCCSPRRPFAVIVQEQDA